MPLNFFSHKYLIIVMIAVLPGCAGIGINQLVKNKTLSVSATNSKPASGTSSGRKSRCIDDVIQRDLSVPWSLQTSYWCGHVYRYHNGDQQIKTTSSNSKTQHSNKRKSQTDREKTIQQLKVIKARLSAYIKPVDVEKMKDNILFAHHSMLLGQYGKKQAEALIDRVSNAKRVLIRGLFEPNEVIDKTTVGKEITSVARALSVRKYWAMHGINVSNVTILHYSKKLFGHEVAVTFR